MDKYHQEVLLVFRKEYRFTEYDIKKIKQVLNQYETFEEREEYLKGIIYVLGQKNKQIRELRRKWNG
jgi:hypothetical protein